MTYGPAIDCNGKRPEWLGDDEWVLALWEDGSMGARAARTIDHYKKWSQIKSFHLPAEHPYYRATDAGFKYWPGGDSAPEDWDSGMVLFRNGDTSLAYFWIWERRDGDNDIIGYHPKPEAAEGIISSDTIAGGPLESQGTSPEAPPAFRPKDLRDEYAMHIAAGLLAAGGMPSDRMTFARYTFEIVDAFMLAREVGR